MQEPIVFWYLGYRPAWWNRTGLKGTTLAVTGQLGVSLAVVIVLVGTSTGTGAVLATHVGFEHAVNEDRYEELELVSTGTEFRGLFHFLGDDAPEVTVVVSRPSDERYPALGEMISARIEDATGYRVPVVVQFVEQQRFRPYEQEREPALTGQNDQSTPLAPLATEGNRFRGLVTL